jgi:lysophospholipase L1-like esterase
MAIARYLMSGFLAADMISGRPEEVNARDAARSQPNHSRVPGGPEVQTTADSGMALIVTSAGSRLGALVACVAALGACSAAGASPTTAPATPDLAPAVAVAAPAGNGDRRVFIEGDSLVVGATPFLTPLLGNDGWTVTLDAQVGRDTATGARNLARRAYELGEVLVVALGTNDLPDPLAFSANIDLIMEIAGGRRVVWVTVARSGWDRLDQALVRAQARWANLSVADWRPIIAGHPDMRAYDGIHLTEAGYRLRASFIADAIERAA